MLRGEPREQTVLLLLVPANLEGTEITAVMTLNNYCFSERQRKLPALLTTWAKNVG